MVDDSSGATETEDQWIKAAQSGDRQAFDRLVEVHGPPVLRYLRGLCGSFADGEDLTQETFCEAYRSLHGFRPPAFENMGSLRAWLLKIAYRCWLHGRRRKAPLTLASPDAAADIAAPPYLAGPPDTGLEHAVRQGLARLPEEQREVFLLRFGEGLSHTEIAVITGCEPATIRWRLFKARQSLQHLLKEWSPTGTGKKS